MQYSVAFDVGKELKYFKLMATTVYPAGKIIHIQLFQVTTNFLLLKKGRIKLAISDRNPILLFAVNMHLYQAKNEILMQVIF